MTKHKAAYLKLPLEHPEQQSEGNIPLDYRLEDQFPRFPLLTAAALSGCHFCGLLKNAIRDFVSFRGNPVVAISLAYRWSCNKAGDLGLTGLFAYLDVRAGQSLILRFLVDGNADACSQWLNLDPPLIPDALHTNNLNLLRGDLMQCEQHHEHSFDDASYFLPTRLIDIGLDRDGSLPRLILTSTLAKKNVAKYAALSYCWGAPADAATQFKTEQSTLNDRLAGFSLDELTSAVRDAVEVTRALSIPYLWVDALCIIQDSLSDWEKESSAMADVYQRAYITICTPNSSSCRQGFLERNPDRITVSFRSRLWPVMEGSYNIRTAGIGELRIQESPDIDTTYDETLADDSAWNRRAWTFQENILSVRQAGFGAFQLCFRCPKNFRSEGGPLQGTGINELGIAHELAHGCGKHAVWHEAVELYVLRDLTRETDRLPAISGLARLVGYSHEDYYAGIWRQGLAVGLSWYRNMHDVGSTSDTKNAIVMQRLGPAARNPSYTAPSWSWATRKQSVTFCFDSDNEDYRMEAHSIHASITLKGLNPFGQVENGSLQICGKMIALPTRIMYESVADTHDFSPYHRRSVYDKSQRVAWVNLDWHFEGSEEGNGDNMLMMLLGSQLHRYEGLNRRTRMGYGIILHSSTIPGKYIRVGAFETDRHGMSLLRRAKFQTVEVI
ncbi:heterokaryon incompatibility protein-domain-containing protein [Xylaria cf. heliscus]|nr:heterokaryon incompatibility protein-domain-containing protein [Xylaria cf. heliscus]